MDDVTKSRDRVTPDTRHGSRNNFNCSASGTDKRGVNGVGGIGSDCESDDGEEGDYTVYECPGLAPVSGALAVHAGCIPSSSSKEYINSKSATAK